MEKERPTWDEYFTKIVQVTSERSPCHRLQVGCLGSNMRRAGADRQIGIAQVIACHHEIGWAVS